MQYLWVILIMMIEIDFVIANEGTDSIGIFIGFNYSSFQIENTYSDDINQTPFAIILADFNNDNSLDIATVFLNYFQFSCSSWIWKWHFC